MHADPSALLSLRLRLDLTEGASKPRLELGLDTLDSQFGGAALPLHAAHEFSAARAGDEPAASGFVLGAVASLQRRRPETSSLHIQERADGRENGAAYGPGLHALGLDPDRMVFVVAPNPAEALRATDEALRSAAVGLVVVELWTEARELDLAATKRFNLAAARTGTGCLLLTRRAAATSAAATRWRIGARRSSGSAGLLGAPAFDIDLTRNRFGRTGQWTVEWDCHERVFRTPADAFALDRPVGDRSPAETGPGSGRAYGGRRQVS